MKFLPKARPSRPNRRAPRPRLSPEVLESRVVPSDTSAPALLQWFDGSDATVERRAADVFDAGYGGLYLPPPGRADSGNQSVGYDVYNRLDLGGPGHPTLYGTETGLKATVQAVHQFGGSVYSDLVWNQDGFRDQASADGQGHTFAAAGGYPGFLLTAAFDYNGDFHDRNDTSTWGMRLAGLIDIAQEKNYQYVRSPVDPNDPRNLPPGTVSAYNGQLANVPDPNNRRFYPDTSLPPIIVSDPTTGEQNIHIYPFNNANPQAGTPVSENALGYLMRYAQWMVQAVGVDGFRIDAAKHFPPWVLNYLDRAVYRSSFRTRLGGSQEPIFSFSEVYDGNKALLQQYVRKDINPNDPGRIGGNRDVLDFPLFFALQQNLTGNGLQNDWRQVVGASQDSQDDGLANNGSQGVSFVSNQDVFAPYLGNVAYAFTLTRPGNALVYFNGKEFGNRDFPKDGRGDALGGLYGNAITNLVNIRDTHPQGNFDQRDLEKEILIFERDDSLLVGLSNRVDNGFDSRTVHTAFPHGTYLIELTGHAGDPVVDPYHDLPPLVQVDNNGNATFRVPRNRNANGVQTNNGYVIYAPSGPQGQLHLTNVDRVIPADTPTASTNGTARLASIPVITAGSFQVELDTNAVNLLGNPQFRDHDADGDNALIKVDDGLDVTGHGFVSTTPGNVAYGYQQFVDVRSPGYSSSNGNGRYVQAIDVSRLSDGMHYLTVRAFRHRNSGEPPIFTDFRQPFYVDRAAPVSAVLVFDPIVAGVNENRRVTVRSTDLLANNVHVFLDLPAGLTDAQVLARVGSGSQANRIDRDLWTKDFFGVTSGNHVVTVVSFKMDGTANVQRFPGWAVSTIFGAGLGDLNFDGRIDAADVNLFGQVLASNNAQFNPAADVNGDGRIDNSDLLLLYPRLLAVGADQAALAAYNQILGPPQGGFTMREGDTLTLGVNQPGVDTPHLTFGWDLTGSGLFADAGGPMPTLTWAQLMALGVADEGTYPVAVQVSDGTNAVVFTTALTVTDPPVNATGGFTVTASAGVDSGSQAVATFTDPGGPNGVDHYAADVDWGDPGLPPSPGVITFDPGTGLFTVSGAHLYANAGSYTVTVTVHHDNAPDAVVTSSAAVDGGPVVPGPGPGDGPVSRAAGGFPGAGAGHVGPAVFDRDARNRPDGPVAQAFTEQELARAASRREVAALPFHGAGHRRAAARGGQPLDFDPIDFVRG
jgi:hypothetical protein